MTIRRRLFWSNILMILSPVLAAMVAGIICIGLIWLVFINGAGLDLGNTKHFHRVAMAITEAMEHNIAEDKKLSDLNQLLYTNGMKAKVLENDRLIYAYGTLDSIDETLSQSAANLQGQILVSENGRSLYTETQHINGREYAITLYGGIRENISYFYLKKAAEIAAIILCIVTVISIFFANRFLTRFVFRRIREPLELLTDGANQLRDGNLDVHIKHQRLDEFMPVCTAFNDMALRLKQTIGQLQRQEQSRKELIAGISHDIRSPLTSIQAYAEGLSDGVAKTPEAQQRYYDIIKTKAGELDDMISQLFLFSKLELGDFPDNAQVLRLDMVTEELIAAEREDYLQQGLRIETDFQQAAVKIDETQWLRVVRNIMGNSLKYKHKEQGLLQISISAPKDADRNDHAPNTDSDIANLPDMPASPCSSDTENRYCRILFADDGPGVPEEALPRLFDVFYRSDPSRHNPQKGSGLGLAIAKGIVEHAGGTIKAFSHTSGGLCIEILLPVQE